MKKRLLIFSLLGPALSFAALLTTSSYLPGSVIAFSFRGLATHYLLALAPFGLSAYLDFKLENYHWWVRAAVVAVVAPILQTLLLLVISPVFFLFITTFAFLIGMPATICSLLANISKESVGT
jgi:hypothetical protein